MALTKSDLGKIEALLEAQTIRLEARFDALERRVTVLETITATRTQVEEVKAIVINLSYHAAY